MTVLVGIHCQDGIVIGADGAVTFAAGQQRTVEQPTSKIEIIDSQIILAGTGSVGLGQRFQHVVLQAWNERMFQKPPIEVVTEVSRLGLINFNHTGLQQPHIQLGALLAFPCQHQPHLCEFEHGTFQPELKTRKLWYVSMGSGQPIVDPFLALMRQAFWGGGMPTHQEAVFAVTWALTRAIACNPGGIGDPIQIAVLTEGKKGFGAQLLSNEELAEHKQNVDGVYEHLREYRRKQSGDLAEAIPVPEPPQ